MRLIHDHLTGRRLADVIAEHQQIVVRCMDGYEVCAEWASSGPELRWARQAILVPDRVLDSRFAFVRGKTISMALTDGEQLLLRFNDGHELAVRWDDRQPDVRAVNCRVEIPSAMTSGMTWGL
jgi:hypothetical protein